MPTDTVDTVASQTAAKAQTSDENGNGSDNLSGGSAAALLFKKSQDVKPAAQEAVEETAPVAQATEETTQESAASEDQNSSSSESTPQAEEQASTEEATATEENAEAEAQGEGEDDVLSQKSQIDPKTKDRIQKRIDREVGKRKALETRNAEMESRLAQLEQEIQARTSEVPPPAPSSSGGFDPVVANINDPAALQNLQKQAKEAIRWAEEQLDRDDVDWTQGLTVGKDTYDRKALKAVVRTAKVTLEDHIPARAQFLAQRDQTRQLAYQEFPFLKDRSTPEYQMAQQALRANPWLANLPNADWILGVQIKGLKAMEAEKAAAKAKAEEAKKPKKIVPTKPSTAQVAASAAGNSTTRAPVESVNRGNIMAARKAISEKGGITTNEAMNFLLQSSRSKSR